MLKNLHPFAWDMRRQVSIRQKNLLRVIPISLLSKFSELLWHHKQVIDGIRKIIQPLFICLLGVILTAFTLVEPLIAACGVALLVKVLGWQNHSIFFWIAISPILYAAWLLLVLSLYAFEMAILGCFWQKPRRLETGKDSLYSSSAIGLILVYRRALLIGHLPGIWHFMQIPVYAWLFPRSYSTKVFIGDRAIMIGKITDPDLTVLGPGVVLGEESRLIAHSVTRSASGSLVFQSALIELGRNVTVGGAAQIEMGVKIGDGSLIEPRAHVMPFTRIPSGEVWGGIPAVFRRKRESAASISNAPETTGIKAGTATKELTGLIAEALSLPPEKVTPSSTSKDYSEWDSIGKMAIAAALHDRFGVAVSPETLFALDSVAHIEQFLTKKADSQNTQFKFLLPENPELFLLYDPALITTALARRKQEPTSKSPAHESTVRVIIASSFTAEPLASTLKLWSAAFGISAQVEFCGFNQVQQSLLSPESLFFTNSQGLNVVILRPEDIATASDPQGKLAGEQLLQAIRHYASVATAPLLVSDLPPIVSARFNGNPRDIQQLRNEWREQLASIDGIEILPFAGIVEELGTIASRDEQMELVASVPYSAAVFQKLGINITRAVRKLRVPPKKVIALDCDGTLWGGVIGEDGMDGIHLGETASGHNFKQFQSQLLALKERGVLLVLLSKNTAADVLNVVENHPGMVLRKKDVAAARINWEAKSKNLRELATELNLGLDSFVLFDDNPVERLEVETNCPEVTVVPLTTDPALYCNTLSKLWLFDSPKLTSEDEARSEYIQQELERKKVQSRSGDLQAYLRSLELKVEVRRAHESDLSRVAQLTQKTNQFNLSLKRRTEQEIRELASSYSIWVISAKDRFGDYGLVGTCILSQASDNSVVLDTFLLSCRVLGRGVEDAFLHGIFQTAQVSEPLRMLAPFVVGSRNQPMQNFLVRHSFTSDSDGIYSVAQSPALPSHLELTTKS
ncbi:MAG: hypothetical protein JWQ71_3228 [Pedosphaera sp.]|nr:hypothetical protein [Pedosphaera sp.]